MTTDLLTHDNALALAFLIGLDADSTTFEEATGWISLSDQAAVDHRTRLARRILTSASAVVYAPSIGAGRHWGIAINTFKGE